ncbi:unnamed protein product [Lactuca virosa]|uniref:Uncharacterized protein n=1 Tax=Lactuca virosa TaxID=75947 RepID=A0AAU9PYJ1_9ASTR|nr:unnamed protein product [Lactuca virosa]
MPNYKRPLKIAVLLSGGVDNSVAPRLLHASGHSCTAFYLKIWFKFETYNSFASSSTEFVRRKISITFGECPWKEDLKYAKGFCNQVAFSPSYYPSHLCSNFDKVVSHTPLDAFSHNHHHQLNLLLTSYNVAGAFMDAISNMDFEFVASRHYAKVIHHLTDETNELLFLQLSKDTVKDQTYFLSCLSQAQLKRLVLPLGCIPKVSLPGNLICLTKKEGIHREYAFLGRYVVEKDVKNNVFVLSRNYYSVDKRRRSFRVGSFRWIDGSPPHNLNHLRCKKKRWYWHRPIPEDDQGLATGPFAAFINKSFVWGQGNFGIMDDAKGFLFLFLTRLVILQKMEDKSKLGQPVKIKPKP